MIKWAAFCRRGSRHHDYFAADKPMVVATFAVLGFMASKVGTDGRETGAAIV